MNTKKYHKISIANDFSKYPAGRFREDGEFSGVHFRDDVLVPALKKFEFVEVNFDGVAGLGSSFLEEAFGGLIRESKMTKEFLDDRLRLYATESDMQYFVDLAIKYINDANVDK